MAATNNEAGSVAALTGLKVAQPRRSATPHIFARTPWPEASMKVVLSLSWVHLDLLVASYLILNQGAIL